MKILAQWVFLLAAVIIVVIGLVHYSPDDRKYVRPMTLGDRVEAACKPGTVSDWHVDYTDQTLLQVTCYFPNTQEIKTTVVER